MEYSCAVCIFGKQTKGAKHVDPAKLQERQDSVVVGSAICEHDQWQTRENGTQPLSRSGLTHLAKRVRRGGGHRSLEKLVHLLRIEPCRAEFVGQFDAREVGPLLYRFTVVYLTQYL